MNIGKSFRKWHAWMSVFLGVIILLITVTGIAMTVRRDAHWVQPSGQKAKPKYTMNITHSHVLEEMKKIPEMDVESWDDIYWTDWRPSRSMLKIKSNNMWEAQMNTATGEVVQVALRNYDWISRLHRGVWATPSTTFNEKSLDFSKIFLVVGVLFLFLVVSGLYMFLATFRKRKAKNLLSAASIHFWLTPIVAIPLFVIAASGIVLQMDQVGLTPAKYFPGKYYPQREDLRAVNPENIDYQKMIEIAKGIPEAGMASYKDVWRVFVYPQYGIATLRQSNKIKNYEVQFDLKTGELIRATPRLTDWVEDIHEGRFWESKSYRYMSWGVFMVAKVLFLIMILVGGVMSYRYVKRKMGQK